MSENDTVRGVVDGCILERSSGVRGRQEITRVPDAAVEQARRANPHGVEYARYRER